MNIEAENTSLNDTKNDAENSMSTAQESDANSEHHHHSDDSEHHHHHHHHHNHHSGDSEHHHHHHSESRHHHHSKSKSGKKDKKRRKFRGIKRTLKSFFSKHLFKNERSETQKQKLLKRALFLLVLFFVFFISYYFIVINSIIDLGLSGARRSPSEADLLRRQLVQSQSEVKSLKAELELYKATFGELDTGK